MQVMTPGSKASVVMADAALSPRDRRRLATQRAIRAAALPLFLDRGFDAVSMEEVADAADFSARTIYRYFPTKEDLVIADPSQHLDLFLDILDRHPGGTTLGEMLKDAFIEWARSRRDPHQLRSEGVLIVTTPALLARMLHATAQWEDQIAVRLAVRSGRPASDLQVR
jgi:AcrR family transcriptional regulator